MNEEQASMRVETNTMVKMICKQLEKLATCERVDAVEDKAKHAYAKAASVHTEIADHIKGHESLSFNRKLILGTFLGSLGSIILAFYALFGRKTP